MALFVEILFTNAHTYQLQRLRLIKLVKLVLLFTLGFLQRNYIGGVLAHLRNSHRLCGVCMQSEHPKKKKIEK